MSVNPPLGELYLSSAGHDNEIPALDKRWTTRDIFANYMSLLSAGGRVKVGCELEEWQYEAETFRDDIAYLLSCPQHVFWSYMVYQKTALASIVSFLQHATPFYLNWSAEVIDDAILELYEELLSSVLRLICRLITNKESPQEWITLDHLRDLIYSNYLISVPMLFDLLVAVGDADEQNAAMLRKICETLLEIAPNYRVDLLAALEYFKTAFHSIKTQAENEGYEGAGSEAPDDSAETPYDDVALYTQDCAYSLSVLLEVFPAVRALCNQIKLGQSIAHFYDTTIPLLYKNIYMINISATSLAWLNQARLQFLRAFHRIAYVYVDAVLAKPEQSLLLSEQYVGLLTECLSEQTFVVDYQRKYPVELDMDILKQACPDLDDFKATFAVKGYQKETDSMTMGTIGHIALTMEVQQAPPAAARPVENSAAMVSSSSGHSEPCRVRDIDLEVNAVLDMLPNLGTGFVRRLLSRYENSEEAIAAIFEENLPPDLVDADQTEVYIPPDVQDTLFQQTGIKHFNVFDGDAYDVMTQDKPDCIIKQGKGFPNLAQNAAELLDDKRDLAKVRHRYQEYTLVEEGVADGEYEDEFDDSYEQLLESEPRMLRSKQLKIGLANVQDVSDDPESDDDEETSTENDTAKDDADAKYNKRIDFCENPEVIRQRYEAQRQAKWAKKGGFSGGGANGAAPAHVAAKSRDVVGAPKGQGQEKETLHNRNKKNVQKSSRANHNRKAGAAFKRSKGMMS